MATKGERTGGAQSAPSADPERGSKNRDSHRKAAERRLPRRRALIVGINEYPAPNRLPSCVRDAEGMRQLLQTQLGFEVAFLTDRDATAKNVFKALDELFNDVSPSDRIVFYFSGHGYQKVDRGGVKQEYLVLADALCSDEEIVRRSAKVPPGTLTLVMDCCFGGGLEKLFRETAQLNASKLSGFLTRTSTLPTLLAASAVNAVGPKGATRPLSFLISRNSLPIGRPYLRLSKALERPNGPLSRG
jgi:hypothetical protein